MPKKIRVSHKFSKLYYRQKKMENQWIDSSRSYKDYKSKFPPPMNANMWDTATATAILSDQNQNKASAPLRPSLPRSQRGRNLIETNRAERTKEIKEQGIFIMYFTNFTNFIFIYFKS